MSIAVISLSILALVSGLALGYAAIRFRVKGNPIADEIEALLPQTQCGQCNYPGCRPYAEAIAAGKEQINRCPPGGDAGIKALAELLGTEVLALDEEAGTEKTMPEVAIIHEDICIGCTKCIQACPVDAILGASKLMHTVISAECTGCELCIPPCPVDCIDMVVEKVEAQDWRWSKPALVSNSILSDSSKVKIA